MPKLNKYIKNLLYGANLWFFAEGMFGPLFAVFAEKVGGTVLDITWAWATYLIIMGVLFIIIGKVVDGKNIAAKIMILGYALNTLFTFGYLFVQSPAHLFLIQAGLGVAAALATPTWVALYSKHENKRHAIFQWGLAGGQEQIVTGIAIIVGGLLVSHFSFTALFILMGSIQLAATIYQARILTFKK